MCFLWAGPRCPVSVCAQQRGWTGKSQGDCRRFPGVLSKGQAQLVPGQDQPKPSPGLPGALLGSCCRKRSTQAENFTPVWSGSVLCRLLGSVLSPWIVLYASTGHPLLPVINMHWNECGAVVSNSRNKKHSVLIFHCRYLWDLYLS